MVKLGMLFVFIVLIVLVSRSRLPRWVYDGGIVAVLALIIYNAFK